MSNKRIDDLTELDTSVDADVVIINDASEPEDTRTKKQTKLNFLKEVWANFANFFTKTQSDARYLQSESDPVFNAHVASDITQPDIDAWNAKSEFSGSYNDLTGKPVIPNELSDLAEDSTHRSVTDAEKTAWNAKSNFSGAYADLTGKPTIPDELSDLSEDATHRTVTDAEKISWNNKSNFSGDYNDLSNKPTLPNELSDLAEDSTHRTVTDAEKSTWNSKQDAGDYVENAELINTKKENYGIVVNGNGSTITEGVKGYREIPADCTITGWKITNDVAGYVEFIIEKSNFTDYPTFTPITGLVTPVTSGDKAESNPLDLADWDLDLLAGDILRFSIAGTPIDVTKSTLTVQVNKL